MRCWVGFLFVSPRNYRICLLVITLGTTIIYSLLYFLGTSTGTSLFGAKPVGFGATTSAPSFSLGGTTGGLFGPTSSLAKPGFGGFGGSTGANTFTGKILIFND